MSARVFAILKSELMLWPYLKPKGGFDFLTASNVVRAVLRTGKLLFLGILDNFQKLTRMDKNGQELTRIDKN